MLKKIGVDRLRTGMQIHELCGSWLDHPFWHASFKLENQEEIETLSATSIREVWIDTARGLDVDEGIPWAMSDRKVDVYIARVSASGNAEASVARHAPLQEELYRAAKICAESREAVTEMFNEARMGRAINAERADGLVADISTSVLRNPDALISIARLKTADDYTYMHSVAVCALMIALGRNLGLPEGEVREAGLAGLLHDVGKMAIPAEILNKAGRLTPEEFAIVQGHPGAGFAMLKEGGGVSDVSLDVCLHHHEKVDGSGYPEGIPGERISLVAKMGAVCDVYDAITSDRPYKKGWDPSEALHKMDEWKNGHFDRAIFSAFVRTLGIYPVGSLVRMKSGRLGVIVEQSENSLVMPKVKVFFSTGSEMRIAPELIDLSRKSAGDAIAGREDPTNWGFPDLATLWQQTTGA